MMNLLPLAGVRVVGQRDSIQQASIEIDLPANADSDSTLAYNKYLLFVFFFLFSIQKYI